MKTARGFFLTLFVAMLISGCGGGENADMSSSSDIKLVSVQQGATPFISHVRFDGNDIRNISSYSFLIEPKAGATAKAVDVTYSPAALLKKGYLSTAGVAAVVPVFGLYAGRDNKVSINMLFNDGSVQKFSVDVAAPAYVDPGAVYDRPTIRKAIAPNTDLGFSYIYLKSSIAGPMVVDVDGEVRWVSPLRIPAQSSIFQGGQFAIGEQGGTGLTYIELDGVTSTGAVAASNYRNFHHTLESGKLGLLGQFDVNEGDQVNLESVLAEFDRTGAISKEWDFSALLARYMRSQGDDPDRFVRLGVDWFHSNAATYDPGDDSLIVSSRENFVVKVDYKTGEIKWIFGDPTKYWYSFPSLRSKAIRLVDSGLYPIGQHAISVTPDGRLMLFNNGAPSLNQPADQPVGEARAYSLVSAYSIDPQTMTARETLRFDYEKSIFSPYCSSAAESATGSLLISYATADNFTKTRLVGLDASRSVAFDIEYLGGSCGTAWNAQPIAFERLSLH